MARTALIDANLPKFFWPFAVRYANHTKNRLPHASLPPNTTPYESITGSRPNISYFKPFGTKCIAKLFDTRLKFDPKGEPGHFIGYAPGAKGYLFWSKLKNKPFIRRDILFNLKDNALGEANESHENNPSYEIYSPLFENPLYEEVGESR